MQDSKDVNWNDPTREDQDAAGAPDQDISETHANKDGWQQYRKWISKAPAPKGRRSGIDPTLYTWKGYRSWSEQIKRNWSDS